MMEILYAMKYQKKVNFSEPYFLACAPPSEIGAEWFVNLYNKYDTKNKGVVGNEHFPSTIYQQYNHPTSALQYAQACEAGLQGVKTSLGFKLKAKPLFFHADWDGTSLRVNKTASSEEMNLLISWFRKNKKPINLHHLYGASRIWHSVVMIGHRPAQTDREEQILIKDSLGELGVGKWVSAENFRQTLYGAITVRDE